MNEYWVRFINGGDAWVYADAYEELGQMTMFVRDSLVVLAYPTADIKHIQKTERQEGTE